MNLFRQGLTADEMAKSISLGALVGIIPLFGISTITITALAVRLKLNLPLSVFVTYAVGPLHLLLFIPFIKTGEWLTGVHHSLLSFTSIKEAFQEDYMTAIKDLGLEVICGLTGWTILAIPSALILYFILRFLFSTYWDTMNKE